MSSNLTFNHVMSSNLTFNHVIPSIFIYKLETMKRLRYVIAIFSLRDPRHLKSKLNRQQPGKTLVSSACLAKTRSFYKLSAKFYVLKFIIYLKVVLSSLNIYWSRKGGRRREVGKLPQDERGYCGTISQYNVHLEQSLSSNPA